VMSRKKRPEPTAQELEKYANRIAFPQWVETADILTASLSWHVERLDAAEAAIQQEMKDRKAGRKMAQEFMLPSLTIWVAPVALRIDALALENLFKAYLAKTLPSKIPSLPEKFAKHDLVKLAAETPVDLAKEEKDLLSHLSAATTWWGRYPVPKMPEDFDHRR